MLINVQTTELLFQTIYVTAAEDFFQQKNHYLVDQLEKIETRITFWITYEDRMRNTMLLIDEVTF